MTALHDRNSRVRLNAAPKTPQIPGSQPSVSAAAAATGEPVLVWLEQILLERFGLPLRLERDGPERLYLRHAEAPGYLLFDACNRASTWRRGSTTRSVGRSGRGLQRTAGHAAAGTGCCQPARPLVEPMPDGLAIHYDILGLTYWMLSRQEEVDARCSTATVVSPPAPPMPVATAIWSGRWSMSGWRYWAR
ncbi:hypothetical protein [Billgrantia tianxiuensis]|uniref:hypothetical protein n=1 Tax=Billgrantia tianxiuensis TaxID=2497861 RepID=UPI001915C6ED|nr:hypothetical protein [Halomonas tianxiuensis]